MQEQTQSQKIALIRAASGKENSSRVIRPNNRNLYGTINVDGENLSIDTGSLVYPFTIDEVAKVSYFKIREYDWYVIYLKVS